MRPIPALTNYIFFKGGAINSSAGFISAVNVYGTTDMQTLTSGFSRDIYSIAAYYTITAYILQISAHSPIEHRADLRRSGGCHCEVRRSACWEC
uniref:Uncharacterized protein n=1 Tax=Anguilla anguilla TaxID=7936 RepID=A0A0E9X4L5_ANGAN